MLVLYDAFNAMYGFMDFPRFFTHKDIKKSEKILLGTGLALCFPAMGAFTVLTALAWGDLPMAVTTGAGFVTVASIALGLAGIMDGMPQKADESHRLDVLNERLAAIVAADDGPCNEDTPGDSR